MAGRIRSFIAASSTRKRLPSGRWWTWITRLTSTPALATSTRPGSNASWMSSPSTTFSTMAAKSPGVGGPGGVKWGQAGAAAEIEPLDAQAVGAHPLDQPSHGAKGGLHGREVRDL